MAGKEWNGFSDEEIKRMQMKEVGKVPVVEREDAGDEIKHIKQPTTKKGILKKTKHPSKTQPILDPITPKQKLSKLKVEFAENIDDSNQENKDGEPPSEACVDSVDSEVKTTTKHVTIDEEKNTIRQGVSVLEQFEQRQKQMEEENAKRRLLLTKAIAYRKKRTQAEAQKLVKVQKELGHLDSLVSVDVSILRNQIEIASMDFTEAQKRYQKAEKEFVEAKLELFQKMQRKEQLTEHLCTIIEQNEARKAKKLVELMQQLEIDALEDSCDTNGVSAVLPQLCALNNVDYSLCTTLKPPASSVDGDNNAMLQNNILGQTKGVQQEIVNINEIQEGTKLHSSQNNNNELGTNENFTVGTKEINDNEVEANATNMVTILELNNHETEKTQSSKDNINCEGVAG